MEYYYRVESIQAGLVQFNTNESPSLVSVSAQIADKGPFPPHQWAKGPYNLAVVCDTDFSIKDVCRWGIT